MILGPALGLPMIALTHVPAVFLGLILTGFAAKAYYIGYLSLSVLLGMAC